MEKLTKIIRVRITESQNKMIGKKVSSYLRKSLLIQLEKDFPENFKLPF